MKMKNKMKNKIISATVTLLMFGIYLIINNFYVTNLNEINIYNGVDIYYEVATVTKNVDGDTIYASINEDNNKLRFIGIDTPESTKKIEFYGKEASNYTKDNLYIGRTIYLEKDVSDVDKYDRLLRYIWLDVPNENITDKEIRTKMYNAILILEGYAEAKEYKPDTKYSEYFKAYEKEAKENKKGMWNT